VIDAIESDWGNAIEPACCRLAHGGLSWFEEWMMPDTDKIDGIAAGANAGTVLIVEDSAIIRRLIKDQVKKLGYEAREAENGKVALDSMLESLPDCVILDLMMPVMTGPELLDEMQKREDLRQVPVIVVTALSDMDKIIFCIEKGAADYMQKPFRAQVLRARLASCIERKKFHDLEMRLQKQLTEQNTILEERVRRQVEQITAAQLSTIFAMCKLAESRDVDTGEHLERVREICHVLARRFLEKPNPLEPPPPSDLADIIRTAAPLHDIGKVAVSDTVLQKPGKLTPEEFEIMKTHTTAGYTLLADVDASHPGNNFIHMGKEIARYHHEKWDGRGYPTAISGYKIPISARIMAVADVYDALVHKRCYKSAMSHEQAKAIILDVKGAHFDPYIVDLFLELESEIVSLLSSIDKVDAKTVEGDGIMAGRPGGQKPNRTESVRA
ncbi:MAG: response regulator, partial [Planctomycetota bacterium]|jgi:putative two-component system response regulator|nr:response regulator [Planctomycetota bacterium]